MALKHAMMVISNSPLYKCGYSIRGIATSFPKLLDQKWRIARGLPLNPNAQGVLTDGPDYTFIDGRPTPYGARQKCRLIKQKDIAERIITMSKEIEFAVQRHNQLQLDEENKKKQIISNKLKPKGTLHENN